MADYTQNGYRMRKGTYKKCKTLQADWSPSLTFRKLREAMDATNFGSRWDDGSGTIDPYYEKYIHNC